jgi:acetyltransferase-like isoleucine patch superfamily enzyme
MRGPRRLRSGLLALVGGLRDVAVLNMPGAAGMVLRRRHFRRRLRHLGENVQIGVGVQIVNPEWVSIADDCWIDSYVILLAGPPREGARKIARLPNPDYPGEEGELTIGPRTHVAAHALVSGHGGTLIAGSTTIGAGARVYSLSHHHRNLLDDGDTFRYRFGTQAPEAEQALVSAPVVVEYGAAVGTNSVVLPGATIGRETWVGAGSVVTAPLEPGMLAWGAPAKIQRPRWGG